VSGSRVLRERGAGAAVRVTNMELFFDLVYVFAITQLSDYLFEHLTVRGALQTLILFTAVWWAWNYTAWATNWIDPERPRVVLLMVVLMAVSLVMSAAIPHAFDSRGWPFAAAYVAIQLIRSAFMVLAFGPGATMRRNYAQLLAWSAIAGVGWILGAVVGTDARLFVWIVAIVLDLGAPLHGFTLPGLGSTPIEEWTLAGSHLAERCQLVLLIALGESVLRVGASLAQQHGSFSVDLSFVAGFIATASLWAAYFLRHAEHGSRAIAGSAADAARVGRAAYAYAHAIMVAGVIVLAVAVRLTIEDPSASASAAATATLLGGPAIYLAGLVVFKRSVSRGKLGPPLLAIGGLALLVLAALFADRLVLACLVAAVLATLAVSAGLEAGEGTPAAES
jgi:low temperature requirement protein LtrA